jgi:hypothetical protein
VRIFRTVGARDDVVLDAHAAEYLELRDAFHSIILPDGLRASLPATGR